MAEFKRERVMFTVVGQGQVDVEYEVGAETPEEAFRRAYVRSGPSSRRSYGRWRLTQLLMDVDDFDFEVTTATEPSPARGGIYQVGGTIHWADGLITKIPTRLVHMEPCEDCEGTGMVMHGPDEVTCGTCGGAKVMGPPVEKSDDPDEEPPF